MLFGEIFSFYVALFLPQMDSSFHIQSKPFWSLQKYIKIWAVHFSIYMETVLLTLENLHLLFKKELFVSIAP